MTPVVVAGLDYSTKAFHIARLRGRELLSVQERRLPHPAPEAVGVIADLVMDLATAEDRPASIMVERPWFRAAASTNRSLDLHARAQWFFALATAAGLSVSWVDVPTWRATVLGNGRLSSEDGKRVSIEFARHEFGYRAPSNNHADAVGLACYARAMQRREAAG